MADLGRFYESSQAYRKSLLVNPNLGGARLNFALLTLTPETLETSHEEMERVSEGLPDFALGLLHLALARRLTGGMASDL